MGPWVTNTFAAFSSRQFRVIWVGSFLAFIAFFMSTVVQSVVAFDLSGNNRAVGFVVFAQGIAQLALGPLGGAMADRLSKRMVILACQTAIFGVFLSLAILVATGVIAVVYLAVGSFVTGVSFSFLGPSRQAWMMELVDTSRRGNAVALSQVGLNASRIIAPLIAGAMLGIGVLGAEGAFFLMAALYVGAIVTTIALPTPRPPAGTTRSVFGDIAIGLRYVAGHGRLARLVLSYVLVIMFGFTYITVLPGLLENELGHDADNITILLGFNAVGGLGASLGVASQADSPHARLIYTAMCLLFGVSLLAMGFAPTFEILAVAMFFGGIGGGGFQTLNGAIVSHITEPDYFGRVVSLTFLAFASSSVFALPVGFLADAVGERPTIWITGAVVCALTATYWFLERAAPTQPLPAEPAPAGGE
jgi:MFS family permease